MTASRKVYDHDDLLEDLVVLRADAERAALAECLICGRPRKVVAVFVPNRPQADWLGLSDGQGIAYSLCESCYRRPYVATYVEGLIIGTIKKSGIKNEPR